MEKKQFPLRIRPTLWAELDRWAADELRSVNGQIEYLLRQAVRSAPQPPAGVAARRPARLVAGQVATSEWRPRNSAPHPSAVSRHGRSQQNRDAPFTLRWMKWSAHEDHRVRRDPRGRSALLFGAQIRMLRINAAAPAAAAATTFAYSPGNACRRRVVGGTGTAPRVPGGLPETRRLSYGGLRRSGSFSRDGLLILGTQPREIAIGPAEAAELVGGDWRSWGDCTFDIDQAHVSAHEDTAWFASTGRVRFDLSRYPRPAAAPVGCDGPGRRRAGGSRSFSSSSTSTTVSPCSSSSY